MELVKKRLAHKLKHGNKKGNAMKAKYWINEDGTERKASYKEFRYYYDMFCASVMDKRGNVTDKLQTPIGKVELIYNGFGIAIAGRNTEANQ